jgi:3-hydroxymyristoyl/3-hydroxydecanoyl-(acyl carrier protein) dehydratase
MQVREEIRLATLDFSNDNIFVSCISDVSPHRKILDKHFKEVVIVNGLLESSKFLLAKRLLAQETPVNTVQECDFIG